MSSKRYSERKSKTNFITKEFAVRGFARELKSRVLDGQEHSFIHPEYSKFADAYAQHISEKASCEVQLHDEYEPTELINSSGYSYWWNGQKYPTPEKKAKIEAAFPGLISKWFDRKKFKTSMQVHLASLDLFQIPLRCNCKIDKKSHEKVLSLCEECLDESKYESELILKEIHKKWRPFFVEPNAGDVCVSDFRNNNSFEAQKCGLNFPYEIMSAYHEGNPYSVVQFLYLLIGLNIKTNVEYRNFLILDFMSSLNAASLLILDKYKSIFTNPSDYIDKNIQNIFLAISELFYEESFLIKERLVDFENHCLEKREQGFEGKDSSIVYPFTHFSDIEEEQVSELFFSILEFHFPYWNERNYRELFNNEYETYDSKRMVNLNESIDTSSSITKSFFAAKEIYFEQFHFVGFSQEILSKELSDMFTNPFWYGSSNR